MAVPMRPRPMNPMEPDFATEWLAVPEGVSPTAAERNSFVSVVI